MTDRVTLTIPYQYRDAGNWKTGAEFSVDAPTDGAARAALIGRIAATLAPEAENGFIPQDVGLDAISPGVEEWDHDVDHCWHELHIDDAYVQEGPKTGPTTHVYDGTLEELASTFELAQQRGWPFQTQLHESLW